MKGQNSLSSVVCICTAVVALAVSTILNILYRKELYEQGINFIYDYQTNNSNAAITVIQNIISLLGNTFLIVAFLAIIHIITYRKMYTIVYLFYISINAYFISVEKQAYHDPRPFHSNSAIQSLQWGCPRSFGFPSGHSWIAILLYQPFLSDIIGTKTSRLLLWISITLTGILIPLSRLYLGAHSSDQIASGILHSISSLILYKYLFQQKIYHLFQASIIKGSHKLICFLNTLFFMLSIAIPFILYDLYGKHRIIEQAILNRLNAACKKNVSQDDLQKQAGLAAAMVGIVFGITYGFLLGQIQSIQNLFLINSHSGAYHGLILYMKGNWNFNNNWINGFKFLVLYIIFGGVFLGGLTFGISSVIKNFYWEYIVQTLGYCLFGISITFFIPTLLLKFDIIKLQIKEASQTEQQLGIKSYRQI